MNSIYYSSSYKESVILSWDGRGQWAWLLTAIGKNNKIEIEFQSKSFLQKQVRSMVGCLKYVGEKKWTLEKFMRVMTSKKRILCAPPAPPEGLYLARVIY